MTSSSSHAIQHQEDTIKDNNTKSSSSNPKVSNVLTVCLFAVVHTLSNSILLSSWNPDRCLLWGQSKCSPDMEWITQWASLGYFHIAILVAGLARAVHGDPANEVRLAYLVGIILCLYIGTALVSSSEWNRAMWTVQLIVWIALLVCGGWFTYYYDESDEPDDNITEDKNDYQVQQHRIAIVGYPPATSASSPLTRRELFALRAGSDRSLGSGILSTASQKSRRSTDPAGSSIFGGKYPIVAIALAVVMFGAVLTTFESAMDESMSYIGDVEMMTRSKFHNCASLVVLDRWIVAIILAVTFRFFGTEPQRWVLWGHIVGMMAYQIMLAGSLGEQMQLETKRSGGVGTFFMILTAIVGSV